MIFGNVVLSLSTFYLYSLSHDHENYDTNSPQVTKCIYKWSLDEVGSRARSERVSKFYGQFAEEADRLGISHACFASYLGYRYIFILECLLVLVVL